MPLVKQDTSKKAKSLAQQVARNMAQEPLEILKQAGQQVSGVESARQPQVEAEIQKQGFDDEISRHRAKIEMQSRRQLLALENELRDIKDQKKQERLLAAQREAQAAEAERLKEKQKPLPKIATKPSRRLFGFGPKAQAEKQKTRVEKPLPPSG